MEGTTRIHVVPSVFIVHKIYILQKKIKSLKNNEPFLNLRMSLFIVEKIKHIV